ncbi:MAG: Holliday junction resolvase RuvX [Candidatus Improbicoccus devescovinae]|nr:MAG: Holliday junction resolvase RuvX [Candidatus Improbicoccus devescovinae]
MILMGIDLGKKRTGIALCDETEILAYPECAIVEKSRTNLINIIKNKIIDYKISKVILGLPKNMNGFLGESAQKIINFKEKMYKIMNLKDLEIELWDERLSTITAISKMREFGISIKKQKMRIDAAAAVVILQSYLDYMNNKKAKI